jgi:hypothetical protein
MTSWLISYKIFRFGPSSLHRLFFDRTADADAALRPDGWSDCARNQRKIAVPVVDLDSFKYVNDRIDRSHLGGLVSSLQRARAPTSDVATIG